MPYPRPSVCFVCFLIRFIQWAKLYPTDIFRFGIIDLAPKKDSYYPELEEEERTHRYLPLSPVGWLPHDTTISQAQGKHHRAPPHRPLSYKPLVHRRAAEFLHQSLW